MAQHPAYQKSYGTIIERHLNHWELETDLAKVCDIITICCFFHDGNKLQLKEGGEATTLSLRERWA
jgi:hypothetical protein